MIVMQISQKKDLLLQQIKKALGGVIYYYKPQDYFFYTSSSIANATKFVNYLDHYQVIGSSFRIYISIMETSSFIYAKRPPSYRIRAKKY